MGVNFRLPSKAPNRLLIGCAKIAMSLWRLTLEPLGYARTVNGIIGVGIPERNNMLPIGHRKLTARDLLWFALSLSPWLLIAAGVVAWIVWR